MIDEKTILSMDYDALTSNETLTDVYNISDPVDFAKAENAMLKRAKQLDELQPFKNVWKTYKKIAAESDRISGECPRWYYGGAVNEIEFCRKYMDTKTIKCIGGSFYGINGRITDDAVKQDITILISPYITTRVAKKTDDIFKLLRNMAYTTPEEPDLNYIHVSNGTMDIFGNFSPVKTFCLNRLNVNGKDIKEYKPPEKWLQFLAELLDEDDIKTLQEYIGYCLVPTNRAQALCAFIGNGGEGKSVVGNVMKDMFGNSATDISLKEVSENVHTIAALESKLLAVDDDLTTQALKDTAVLKKITTCKGKMQVNPKHQALREVYMYARLLIFGNVPMSALYDRSDGLFRRQLVFRVKDKEENREDNPVLVDELIEEKDDIFLWAILGLQRLMSQKLEFTVGERTKQYMNEIKEDSVNILAFLKDDSVIQFNPDGEVSSKELYETYTEWCERNALDAFKQKSFVSYLKDNSKKLKIKYSENIGQSNGKPRCRGFKGIEILKEVEKQRYYPF